MLQRYALYWFKTWYNGRFFNFSNDFFDWAEIWNNLRLFLPPKLTIMDKISSKAIPRFWWQRLWLIQLVLVTVLLIANFCHALWTLITAPKTLRSNGLIPYLAALVFIVLMAILLSTTQDKVPPSTPHSWVPWSHWMGKLWIGTKVFGNPLCRFTNIQ